MFAYGFAAADLSKLSAVLTDATTKSFLLLTVILAGAWLMRRRSAATVHRWWTFGFGGCLLVPVIALIAPVWTVPRPLASLLPVAPTSTAGEVPPMTGGASRPFISAVRDISDPQATAPVGDPQFESLGPSASSTVAHSPPGGVAAASAPRFSWSIACLSLWAGGVALCLFRMTWQQLTLARLLRRCIAMDAQGWPNALAEASRALNFNGKVRLLIFPEARSPMVAGVLRNSLLLPKDAANWDPKHRQLVLLHELAHLKRRDILTQTLAALATALYWFNPIAWFGLSQMRKLRELACDDLVLTCGHRPVEYASVLLQSARSYRHREGSAAVAMVRGSSVHVRINAVLDTARAHVELSSTASRRLLVFASGLVVLIGSINLSSQDARLPAPREGKSAANTLGPPDQHGRGEVAEDASAAWSAPAPARQQRSRSAAAGPAFDVSATGAIAEPFGGIFRGHVDLGPLPANAEGRVEIELVNPFDWPIPLDGLIKNCDCTEVEHDAEVPANGSTWITLWLRTPTNSRRPEAVGSLTFRDLAQRPDQLRLSFAYEIEGVLSFVDRMTVLDISPETRRAEFDIPVVLTKPLSWDTVQIQVSRELQKLTVRPGEVDGHPVLHCSIVGSDLPAEGIGGTIHLSHEGSGRHDTLNCIIRSQAALTVSPRILRFFPIPDSDEYEATAFLRLRSDGDSPEADLTSAAIVCSLDGIPLASDSEHLAGGVSRATIRISRAALEPTSAARDQGENVVPSILWQAKVGRKSHYFRTEALLSSDANSPPDD